MYLILGIFAIIPLIFSHTFARFWADFIIDNNIGHFESIKMHFFLILLVLASIEIFTNTQKWRKIMWEYKKNKYFLSGCFLFFLLAFWIYPYEHYWDLLLGIGEKQHGLLLPFGLIWFYILLHFLEKSELQKIGYTIIGTGSIVALVALIEILGYNIFTGAIYSVEGSWWEVRSTSTLGNPNYVAGYLLMILPLIVFQMRGFLKYILFIALWSGIIATKSMIGIWLLLAYSLYLLGKKIIPKKIHILFPVIMILGGASVYFFFAGTEKWLSLTSRFVLMKHTFLGSLDSMIAIWFWHGPDAIIRYFSFIRAPEIDAYFPPNMIIDSSHNIFIDILSMYGVIGVGFFVYVTLSRLKHLDHASKVGLMLGLSFLSLNVFVLSHMILLVYFLSFTKKS